MENVRDREKSRESIGVFVNELRDCLRQGFPRDIEISMSTAETRKTTVYFDGTKEKAEN